MGKVTGFLEYPANLPPRRASDGAHQRLVRNLSGFSGREIPRRRARAAWIAAFPSVTPAARSTIIIPDWNDLVYAAAGKKPFASFTPPTISPSSPAASAPLLAKHLACSASTSRR